jgi:hypothetical protein
VNDPDFLRGLLTIRKECISLLRDEELTVLQCIELGSELDEYARVVRDKVALTGYRRRD